MLSVCLLLGGRKGVFCIKNRFRLYFAFYLTLLRCVLCQEWFLFVILLSSALLWCVLYQEPLSFVFCVFFGSIRVNLG